MFICVSIICIDQVIETVGKGITELDFHKAFCANAAAVIAVVVSTIFHVRFAKWDVLEFYGFVL